MAINNITYLFRAKEHSICWRRLAINFDQCISVLNATDELFDLSDALVKNIAQGASLTQIRCDAMALHEKIQTAQKLAQQAKVVWLRKLPGSQGASSCPTQS
jgi:hypothetical protein